jgi:hypothetical protein
MPTYTLISNITLSTATSFMEFTSIPATYTNLEVVGSFVPSADMYVVTRFNNVNTNSYYEQYMGNGGGSRRAPTNGVQIPALSSFASGSCFARLVLHNYAQTTNYQAGQTMSGSSSLVAASIFTWRSTAAINAISFVGSANFAAGTSVSLYGIVGA